jgi:glycosyltransferase involved in cell wall biosynthesis
VHADSEHVAREVVELLGVPAERVRAVHLGVSSPAGPPPNEPGTGDELRGRLATVLPDWVTSYVLGLSRVEPRKDFPTLVRAFGQIAAAHPGLALVLAGPDGLGSARLGQAVADCPAADRVVRLGWVDDGLKEALVAGATVFAYPSVYEGFGLPPLEAMAMGTPVVATRAGALPEVLGDAARLVAVGDGTALAAALGELVDDPAARLELSNRGRRRAAQFTWASCADGLVALYEQAAYEQAARAARGG